MRQILFHLLVSEPLAWWRSAAVGDLPGVGLTVFLLCLGLGWTVIRLIMTRGRPTADDRGLLVIWGGAIGVSLFVGQILSVTTLPVFGFGVMLLLAFLSATGFASWRARQVGLPEQTVLDLAIVILLSGIAGARAFYLIQNFSSVYADVATPWEFLRKTVNLSEGGIVLYGGVIAGAVAFAWFCRQRKLRPLAICDLVIPSVFIGLAFGRLGCFCNGCCFGDPTGLPWGVEFPAGSIPFLVMSQVRSLIPPDAASTMPLHPTQIYSSINALLLAVATWWYYSRRSRDGEVLLLGWIAYPIARFTIEALRSDEGGQFGTSLTISQWVSLGMVLAAVVFAVWLYARPASRQEFDPTDDSPGRPTGRQPASNRAVAAS